MSDQRGMPKGSLGISRVGTISNFLCNELANIDLLALKDEVEKNGAAGGEIEDMRARRDVGLNECHPIFTHRGVERMSDMEGLALSVSLKVAPWNKQDALHILEVNAFKLRLKGGSILTRNSSLRPLGVEESVDDDNIK